MSTQHIESAVPILLGRHSEVHTGIAITKPQTSSSFIFYYQADDISLNYTADDVARVFV